MSDKVALVRLRAKNDEYDAAMRRSAKATTEVGDAARTAGRTASDAFSGKDLDQFASGMTRKVTVPLLALGGAAVKVRGDIDATFTEMITLGGVAAEEIDGLRNVVNDIAVATGRGPQEVAEGLLDIVSAGYTAADAVSILEQAARGAAIGLGETGQLTNLSTSAIMAYGAEALNAAEITDILTASAQASKIEASELAPQMGRLLPVAAELGVEFSEVAAAVSAYGGLSGDAALASTQLAAIMNKLLSPTQQGTEALEAAGISVQDLHDRIARDGLIATVQALKNEMSDMGFRALFDDSRALTAALISTGTSAEMVTATIDEVANSAGAADTAFAIWADSMGAKNAQAFSTLMVSLVELGGHLAPLAADIVAFASAILGAFAALPEPMQRALIGVGMLAAATGPAIKAGRNLQAVWGAAEKVWDARRLENFRLGLMGVTEAGAGASNRLGGLVARMGGLGTVAGVAGLAVVGLGAVIYGMADDAAKAAARAALLESEIATLVQTASAAGETIEEAFIRSTLVDWFTENAELAQRFGVDAADLAAAMLQGEDAVEAYYASLTSLDINDVGTVELASAFDLLSGTLIGGRAAAEVTAGAQQDLAAAGHDVAGAQAAVEAEVAGATAEIDKQAAAVDAVSGAFDAWQSASDGVASAQDRLASAQAGVVRAQRQVEDASKAVAQAQRGVQDAARGVADAQRSAADAAAELAAVQREQIEGSKEIERANRGVEDAEKALAQAQRDSKQAQEDLTAARDAAAERLANLEQAVERQALSEREARLAVAEARERISDLDGDSTGNERERAAIALQRAEWRLADVLKENADREAKLATERAKGVDASDEVVAAHDRIEQAADRERQAEEALVEAQAAVAQAHEDMARRVEEAQRKVEDANYRVEQAQQRAADAADRVREAQQRVVEATAGVTQAHGEVEKAVRDVEQAHLDAYLAEVQLRQEMERNPGALRKYREDLEKLAEELGPNAPARSRLDQLIARIREAEGRHEVEMAVTITGPDRAFLDESGMSIVGRRFGGVDVHARHGATVGPMIATAPTVLFGERETHKEAFVPANVPSEVAEPILAEAASWHGMSLVGGDAGMAAAPPTLADVIAAGGMTGRGDSPLFAEGAVQVLTGGSIDPYAVGVMTATMTASALATAGQ